MPADGGTGAIIHLPISRLREKVHEAHAVRWLLGTSSTLVLGRRQGGVEGCRAAMRVGR